MMAPQLDRLGVKKMNLYTYGHTYQFLSCFRHVNPM